MTQIEKSKYDRILKDAIGEDGLWFCLNALQEESAELIQSINHLRRERTEIGEVLMEMADVQIMLDMCRVGIEDVSGFNDHIERKMNVIGASISFKKGKRKRGGNDNDNENT